MINGHWHSKAIPGLFLDKTAGNEGPAGSPDTLESTSSYYVEHGMERRKFIGGLPLMVGGALVLRGSDAAAQTSMATPINVKSYGAVGDGKTDDTVALQNAINAAISGNASLFVPSGQYVHGPLTAAGGALKMVGEGRLNSVLLLNASGVSLTFSNSNFSQIQDMGFGLHGGPQTVVGTDGPTMSGSCDNSEWRGCNFSGFGGSGLAFSGDSSGQSGHKVIDCYFLGNGGVQLDMAHSNDFHIVDNQFGVLEGVAGAQAGCNLNNSAAGTYKGNYHWGNVVAFTASSAHYLRVIGNRFEMSGKEGVVMNGCVDVIFSNNSIHTNSQSQFGAYDNAYFSGMTTLIISNNNSFDWSGGSSYHRWGINIDAGCADVTLCKNKCSGYASSSGPTRVDGSVVYSVSPDAELYGSTSSTVPGGVGMYLGVNGAQVAENATLFVVTRKCTIQSFAVDTDVAPGDGQSFNYVLRVNNANTSMIGSSSGAQSWSAGSANSAPAVVLNPGDRVSILLQATAGATAAYHRYFVALTEY